MTLSECDLCRPHTRGAGVKRRLHYARRGLGQILVTLAAQNEDSFRWACRDSPCELERSLTPSTIMPSNKKKKKPISNPSRGFATVSTTSKVKPQEVQTEDVIDIKTEFVSGQAGLDSTSDVLTKPNPQAGHVQDLCEVTPAELERQLEESSLQMFVEQNGTKVKKDVSRYSSRLCAERRITRNQAEFLNIRQWLPPEIVQFIIASSDQPKSQLKGSASASQVRHFGNNISDDDLLARLWTLRQLLPQIGYSVEATNLALRHLLESRHNTDAKDLLPAKDSIWGLDLCLQWLALNLPSDALPSFESPLVQKHADRKDPSDFLDNVTEASRSLHPFLDEGITGTICQ